MQIPSPLEIRNTFPASKEVLSFIEKARQETANIILHKTKKIALLVGPCSIHDPELALEYASRLQSLSRKTKNILLIMRLFLEKPRTHAGWKGLIYDPRLDSSYDFSYGLKLGRKLLLDIASLGIACSSELLDPLVVPYFDDLISWGIIGARTSASQPHRQLASGLAFPVGFKNGIHGELDSAIYGILSSQDSHTHLSIDENGRIFSKQTKGNSLTHLVLRGSDIKPNYDAESVGLALDTLKKHHLEPKVLIDCSHGNSNKDHKLQSTAFKSVIEQLCLGNDAILGLMLESHIRAGKQPLGKDPSKLSYGVSITDACIGWEETESLILWADEKLSSLPTSISFVQK